MMATSAAVIRKGCFRFARVVAFVALALLFVFITVRLMPSNLQEHHETAISKDLDIANHQLGHAFRFKRDGVIYARADNRTIKARTDSDDEAPARPLPGGQDKGKGRASQAPPARPPPGVQGKGKGRASEAPPPPGFSQGHGSPGIPAEGVAGSSQAVQGNTATPHTSQSGMDLASAGSPVPMYIWLSLIHRAWQDFIPMMMANADRANVLIGEYKGFDPFRNWQINPGRHKKVMDDAHGPTGYWTRTITQDHDLGVIAPAFSHLDVPSSNPIRRVSFSATKNVQVINWKQNGQVLAKHLSMTQGVTITNAEYKILYNIEDGVIILLHARSLNEEGALDPLIQRLKSNSRLEKCTYVLEQVLKFVQSPQQLMAYDWNDLRTTGQNVRETKLHYVAMQSARLSEASLEVIGEMTEIAYHGQLPTYENAKWFKAGDPFYECLLAMPEFELVAWLFSQFKATLGSRMPSEVIMFGAAGDTTNAPNLIWRVEDCAPDLEFSTNTNHYKAFQVAIAERVVNNDYMTKDERMQSLEQHLPRIEGDRNYPWPAPKHIVRFFESIARKNDQAPNQQPMEQQDIASAPKSGSLDADDVVWEDWLNPLSKSPSPMGGLDDEEMRRIQQQGLPADFGETLDRAISENEQQLSSGRPNPGASSSDTSPSKRRKSHRGQ